ncbi:unnamed protein product [Penicillium salamii]|uniref:Protein kinase domain-containing protein n=1 Tax=Penicillium salamii TaxID=1612424 RepID=A0A9W4IH31_9EURO|nr:unnamed protein product [Penicillium salamii]
MMTANSPLSREIQTLEFLESHGGLSSNYLVQLLDSFTHMGPNGAHQCLVYYFFDHEELELEIILRISEQLLKAVSFMHSAGMSHGGIYQAPVQYFCDERLTLILLIDISGRNIALTCTNLSQASEDQLFQVLGYPEHEPLSRAASWVEWAEEDEEDIRLFDFGESFFHGREPEKLAQPGSLKVPETIFTDVFDYRVDLWRAGCMIYYFVFATWPFWYLDEDDVLAYQMIEFMGKLPNEWESKWELILKSSQHDLSPKEDLGAPKLEQKFRGLDSTLKPLLDVIQGLMRFLPLDRLTTGDALGLLGRA